MKFLQLIKIKMLRNNNISCFKTAYLLIRFKMPTIELSMNSEAIYKRVIIGDLFTLQYKLFMKAPTWYIFKGKVWPSCFVWLDSLHPSQQFFSYVGSPRRVCLGGTSTKQGLKCLAQGHNPVPPVRPEPATFRSRVKHSTTEPPMAFLHN